MSIILDVADAIATDIQTRITADSIPDTTVSRQYDITYDLGSFTGRKVDVFPVAYDELQAETREEEQYTFNLSIVVLERYRDKGLVTKEWLDERVDFTERYLFEAYKRNESDNPYFVTVDSIKYWITERKITSVYDYDMLKQHRVFWSELELMLNRISDGL